MDRFTDWFHTRERGLTTAQRAKIYEAFGKVVRQIEDADGRKIFRYNSRTHEVELIDGRKLPPVNTSSKPKYSTDTETKKDAFDGAFTSDGRLKNPWKARQIFETKIEPLRKNSWINKATGIVAQISHKGVGKLVSDKALEKSLANGYTARQHFEAAMDIKRLFEDAELAETREDKNQQQDVTSIKYFHCDTTVGGEKATARIMAKETLEHGHRIYTIGLQELNKPAELKNRNGTNSSAGSEGSTLGTHIADSRDAEEPSAETITHEEDGGKGKYSLEAGDNSRTHEVELADGRKLPTVDTHSKPKYSTEAGTKKAAVTVTGDEFGEYTDIKDLRKKAKDFYKNILRGTSVQNPILGEVELTDDTVMFTNIGLNKMGATSAQQEKLLLVKHLPELIESADRVSAEENYKNKRNASKYSYLHSTALVNGKIRDVNITIFSDANGNRYYNHNLNNAAKTVEGLPVHLAQAPQSKGGIPTIGKPSAETISHEEDGGKVKYSLEASDNSGESLLQRIRNKLPEWIGGRTDLNERRNKGITRKLSELSGYKVAFGHTGADETIIDDLQKVIRTRHAYDWEKILPAVGAKIARNLKVSATPEMSNYIADWILTGAPNNTSAEAKAFQKAARENPALFELLNSVRNDFQEYADMSANERVKSKIVSEPPKKSLFERIGELRRGDSVRYGGDFTRVVVICAELRRQPANS